MSRRWCILVRALKDALTGPGATTNGGVAMRRRFYCCHGLPRVGVAMRRRGLFVALGLQPMVGVAMRRRFYCCHGLPMVGVAKRRPWCILVHAFNDVIAGP